MENMSNLFSTLSINIMHPEYNLEIKISFESRTVNINIVLANPSLNYVSANLGTEMVSEPNDLISIPLIPIDFMNNLTIVINDPLIPINNPTRTINYRQNNDDDYISDKDFETNPVPIRYFNNEVEYDDSDWHYPSP